MGKKGELSILLAVLQLPELLQVPGHHGRGSWLPSSSGVQAEVQDEGESMRVVGAERSQGSLWPPDKAEKAGEQN